MKIQLLQREEINDNQWNACLLSGINALVYAHTDYLDILTDNNWMGLVAGNYEAVFPLPLKKKFGFSYVVQPPFCAQLGAFGNNEMPNGEPVFQQDFIARIPIYLFRKRLHLNPYFPLGKDLMLAIGKEGAKQNLILDLSNGYQANKDATKNIARLNEKGICYQTHAVTPAEIISFYKKQWGNLNPSITEVWYDKLQQLCAHFKKMDNPTCEIVSAHGPNGDCLGGGIFFKTIANTERSSTTTGDFPYTHKGFIHYVCGAANVDHPDSKGVMHGVLDFVLRAHQGQNFVFDFEGSSIDSVAAFYQKFNPQSAPYFFFKSGI